jgi:hypothetical protein
MPLPDVAATMKSFERALKERTIAIQPGALDPNLFVHMDQPNGAVRLTYVRLDRGTVTAIVQFIRTEPVEGEPCFSVGWAVPESHRGQHRAAEAFLAAVKELRHGFAPLGMKAFWVEGIVGQDNIASQRVAEKVISAPVSKGKDCFADVAIVQYLRRIDPNTVL